MVIAKPFPHCYRGKDRQGRERWILRVPGRKAITIKGRYGSPEFAANYRAALTPLEQPRPKGKQGTIAALARAYLASAAFAGLASETRRHKRSSIEQFARDHGDRSVANFKSKHVRAIVGAKARTPGQARTLLSSISVLMTYAVDMGLGDDNPCRGVKRPKLSKDGWHSWTDDEIGAFRDRHPIGGMARLALELGLCSTQRRSDLVRLGRQLIKDGLLTVRQQKTGNLAHVTVSLELQAAIDAAPNHHLTFLVNSFGAPFTPGGFTHWFRHRVLEAGLNGCPLHGLRKAGARLAVEAGCDVIEVAAIGGWKSVRELQRYIEAYNREQAARRAGAKIRTATLTRTHGEQKSHTPKKA